jgi:hypothetical protein
LQTVRDQLSKAAYDNNFDINGPANQMELKRKLAALLLFSDQENLSSHSVDGINEDRYEQLNNNGLPIVSHYITTDTSHFQQLKHLCLRYVKNGSHDFSKYCNLAPQKP